MRRRDIIGAALGAMLLAACGRRDAASGAEQRFPALALPDLESGTPMPPDALHGRALLVNFWATWCPPCRREMASLERLSLRTGSALLVVGISVDEDVNLAREFVRKTGVTFVNLTDPAGRATGQALGVNSLPETFLVSRSGSIRRRVRGAREWDDAALAAELLSAAAEPA